ncbi:MAG: type II toxin-antitoxin system VapC family toxin [Deltaproteobacteria bacterium]|nr:type II toxin-antitoxin system VapC family toxin [Deltaproteobacteria bacterium]MBN2674816.1 type II toxin-antitoxin system VapC family toxin [Deltaproteobacteria bacterium]
MNIIIDTHIFLWALSEPEKISEQRRVELQTLANVVHVSAVSVSEIAIKRSIGKLDAMFDTVSMIERSGFTPLEFRCEDAALLERLPYIHKDPFDRMLIAQSVARNWPIMTDDPKFRHYDCKCI